MYFLQDCFHSMSCQVHWVLYHYTATCSWMASGVSYSYSVNWSTGFIRYYNKYSMIIILYNYRYESMSLPYSVTLQTITHEVSGLSLMKRVKQAKQKYLCISDESQTQIITNQVVFMGSWEYEKIFFWFAMARFTLIYCSSSSHFDHHMTDI